MSQMDPNVVGSALVASLWHDHGHIPIQEGVHIVTSNAVADQGDGYGAWLEYRQGQPLMVVTPAFWQVTQKRRSDQRYWHQLAVGYEIVVRWQVPVDNDPGEVHWYYCPNPMSLVERYHINGEAFGGTAPTNGMMDRVLVDAELPGNVRMEAGFAVMVTACPARFAFVAEFRHQRAQDPNVQRDDQVDLPMEKGISATRGAATMGIDGRASTFLGRQQYTTSTARYRIKQVVMYVEAFPIAIPK